jgi:hypothetical protein
VACKRRQENTEIKTGKNINPGNKKIMQRDNHNMDKKLRQLENQSLPDLSGMDEHWQQLKNSLQPGNKAGWDKKTRWRMAIAACLTGIVCLTVYTWLAQRSDKVSISRTGIPAPGGPSKVPVDTAHPPTVNNRENAVVTGIKKPVLPAPVKLRKHQALQANDRVLPAIPQKDTTHLSAKATQVTLEDFFGQLEKPAQEFMINNQRDTVITGQDGTALLIRAHTFSTKGAVTIIIKEFYSYRDIVTNRLSTLSNGNQLITGGMIHIMAMADGKEVNIQPGRSIRWFIPDTTAEMGKMQLFYAGQTTAATIAKEVNAYSSVDTILSVTGRSSINWIPQSQPFGQGFLTTRVKVLDVRDSPFKVVYGKKVKARFYISRESVLDKEELRDLLAKRYPKYDRIVLRKSPRTENGHIVSYTFFGRKELSQDYFDRIGDSAWITPAEANRYKLSATDTATYWSGANFVQNNFFRNEQLRKIAGRYSVDITSLGWINCDRFLNDNRPKISFAVNLSDTASAYSTFLVFDRMKSMMAGTVSGNRVLFFNVPEGETAKVIAVGVQNNKTVSAMQDVVLSPTPLSGLHFEETSSAEFKEQVSVLDE